MASWLGGGKDPKTRKKLNRVCKIVGFVTVMVVLAAAVTVYYRVRTNTATPYPCDIDLSVPLFTPRAYRNGSVEDHGDVYPAGYHFTLNGTTRGCLCKMRPCIRKCCARGEHMVKAPMKPAECKHNPDPSPFDNFTLSVYQSPGIFADVAQDHFRILYGDVCRHGKFMLTPEWNPKDEYELMEDGTIRMDGTYIDASGYCFESLNGSDEIRALVCFPDQESDPETKAMFTLYPIGMISSIPFIVITFLVYSILPELRNLHGISLMCQSACLFTSYLFLTIIQIGRDDLSYDVCVISAFIVQFSFLATFFWLNVMCFDLWLVFSSLGQGHVKDEKQKHKKFLRYSLYAWGVPSIIVGVSIAMDTIPSIPDDFIKPGFGKKKCWFEDSKGQLLYFYLPVAVVVFSNIIMFVSTTIKLIAELKKNKTALNNSESATTRRNNQDRFYLYLKLFIVMGINWVMELISFFIGGPKSMWFVSDIGNTLQGVLIFVIFVCKRRILLLLNNKLCPRWRLIQDHSSSGRSKVSSSRTNSTTTSRVYSEAPDSLALKPIARDSDG